MTRRVISESKVKKAAQIYAQQLLHNTTVLFDAQIINANRKKKISAEVINEQVLPEVISYVSDIFIQSGYNKDTVYRVLSTKGQCLACNNSEPEQVSPARLLV